MNDSTFNAKNYYLPKKIMTYAEAVSLEVIGEDGSFSLSGMFRDINESLTAKITAHSSAVNGGLQAAVLLGNKDHLSDVTVRDFRRLGISHLLVVSGMHFAIIVSFIERTLRRLRINKRYRAIFNMFFIVFIMALMGFTPSVTRAGIMCLLAQLVQLTSRRFDQLTSLALAGTVMIISNPYIALDCGMQLSFISTYSCLVFVRFRSYFILKARRRGKKRSRPSKLLRFMRSIMETVLLTLFVNLSILPITYLYFGEISLMAIPANIIFIPAITILMYLTAVYLILYPLRIFIIPLSTAIGWYCNLIESIASALSELNFSIVAINYSWCVLFIIPITLLIFVFPYVSKKNIKRVGVVLISAIFLFGVSVTAVKVLERDDVTVSYVSENKNDGIVVKSNGKIMLCDFSDASFGFSKEMLTEMTELHVTEIDAVLFTHYHSKHVQLLNRLSDREIVRSIILTEPINETEYTVYDSLYKTALSKGIVVYSVSAGEVFEFEDTEIFIFERKYISRSTHPITALQISAYGESVTYASGSFNQSVAEIMDSLETSEHVILGRHSPVYKKEFELNFDITPASVVISNDSYNHMSEDTQDYVNSVGALIDVDGYRLIIKRKE